jgi:ribosomal protein S18 acetylase RimI-like enzyme
VLIIKKQKKMEADKLDNPTWNSLCEIHKDFAVDYKDIKFYNPDYCPFGGFINMDGTKTGIDLYVSLTNNFFVVGNKPDFNDKVRLKSELICNQMVLYKRIDIEPNVLIVKLHTEIHMADLYKIVNLVQPGYFKNKTQNLGSYYGFYIDNNLIAVTGERMKMDSYTELSAIVTHPDHTGKGYAKQLITHATNKIFNEGKTPYLHVVETNIGAIRLYEKLGFVTRRKISFWNFILDDK